MHHLKNVESASLTLVDSRGNETSAVLVFVRTKPELASALADSLRNHPAASASDLKIIIAPAPPYCLVGIYSTQSSETALWELYEEIVPWFEGRGFKWGIDTCELMSAGHLDRDYPAEFREFMSTQLHVAF